ncbi:hypothetical protein FH972_021657 [Carpinus fangiana]|uniref:Major facilitator superfamily (MFS) profile domain-containing protein n=1 Tax=Carpinus fangiana TaxID=176857 RepID=A0A5N6KPY3_9ROSI|nr:hypothetical protein FH972_021657 [Carpinus fangiana]
MPINSEVDSGAVARGLSTAHAAANPSANASPSSSTVDVRSVEGKRKSFKSLSILEKIVYVVEGPPWTKWNPDKPSTFSVALNVLFAFAGAFTVANLYYNQPILNILAEDFDVPYETVSRIPTLAQAGYCVGLLLLCPLGDWVKRRPFVLALMFFAAALWIPLCITNSFNIFLAFQFLACVFTVTPQLMLPLVGDLAPPHRRALALSIASSGNILGILLARILSGVVTEYTSWRNIYWLALGLQYFIFTMLWLFMPDYPRTNRKGFNYFKILWSIVSMYWKYPILVQASIVGFITSATFTCFWTTLTFLLSGDPYHYSTLVIGLFALIGLAAIALSPIYAKYLIDKFVPLFSAIVGMLVNLVGVIIGTYTGTFTVAGPVIMALFMDAAFQVVQIANRSAIYAVEPNGRNKINTGFMVSSFCGQLTGTAAGNHLYAQGGWRASGSMSVGLAVFALVVLLARGPWEEGWLGWSGGYSIRKKDKTSADGKTAEREMHNTTAGDRERAKLVSLERAMEEATGEAEKNELRQRKEVQEGVVEAVQQKDAV